MNIKRFIELFWGLGMQRKNTWFFRPERKDRPTLAFHPKPRLRKLRRQVFWLVSMHLPGSLGSQWFFCERFADFRIGGLADSLVVITQ
jgi:hypothetical protein